MPNTQKAKASQQPLNPTNLKETLAHAHKSYSNARLRDALQTAIDELDRIDEQDQD